MKRGINFKMSNTVFRVSFAVLRLRIGTQFASKHPPWVQNAFNGVPQAKEVSQSLLKQCDEVTNETDMTPHTNQERAIHRTNIKVRLNASVVTDCLE